MTTRSKVIRFGGLTGLILLAFVAGVLFSLTATTLFAQTPPATPTHEPMHRMMDAVHGTGTSQRMHEALGPDAEQLMDECVAMMGAMQTMSSMMGDQNSQPMRGMMDRMMRHRHP